MAAYTNHQHWKKEDSGRLRREGDKIMFIDVGFESGQVVGLGKGRRKQDVS